MKMKMKDKIEKTKSTICKLDMSDFQGNYFLNPQTIISTTLNSCISKGVYRSSTLVTQIHYMPELLKLSQIML